MLEKDKIVLREASPYNAAITREQFLFYEVRTTAKLVCEGLSNDEVVDRIVKENLFQYPTEKSVKKMALACLRRLEAVEDQSLVEAIADQPSDVSRQICLYAMMRQYRLVQDFMLTVVGEKYRKFMDADKIIQDLNRKFAAPLPEFYKRRIVIWYDEDREFEDQIDSLTITGAKILKLTGSNNFYAKKLLAVDDPTSSYLVYCPLSYETEEDDWLLDVELYGEEFRADQISMWMDEMQIPETPALRKAFKQYRKFFKAQGRRNKVVAQGTTPSKPAQLQMAIMAALANIKEPKPAQIMKAISTTTKDYIINYQDLQGIGITGKLALPSLIALCSIALGRPTLGSLAVLGEISISGTMIKVDELANTLQCCLDSGAKKVLIPSVSMIDFATVPADLMGAFQLIPFSSAEDAVFKALGVE